MRFRTCFVLNIPACYSILYRPFRICFILSKNDYSARTARNCIQKTTTESLFDNNSRSRVFSPFVSVFWIFLAAICIRAYCNRISDYIFVPIELSDRSHLCCRIYGLMAMLFKWLETVVGSAFSFPRVCKTKKPGTQCPGFFRYNYFLVTFFRACSATVSTE